MRAYEHVSRQDGTINGYKTPKNGDPKDLCLITNLICILEAITICFQRLFISLESSNTFTINKCLIIDSSASKFCHFLLCYVIKLYGSIKLNILN